MHAENKYFNKTSFYVHALLSMTVLSTHVIDHIIWWRSYSKMKFIDLFLAISQRNWELPWCINLLPVSACSLKLSQQHLLLVLQWQKEAAIATILGLSQQLDNPPFLQILIYKAVYYLLRFEQLSLIKINDIS